MMRGKRMREEEEDGSQGRKMMLKQEGDGCMDLKSLGSKLQHERAR